MEYSAIFTDGCFGQFSDYSLCCQADSEYKTPVLGELEEKMAQLRDANRELREVNQGVGDKLQVVEGENESLKEQLALAVSQEDADK